MSITVYSQPNCGGCKFTESFFNRQGVEFTKVDVSVDEGAARMLRDRGYSSTPVVIVEHQGRIIDEWSGLDHGKLKTIARSAGKARLNLATDGVSRGAVGMSR